MGKIQPGRSLVKVVSHVLGKSPNTGTEHVAVLFEDEKGDRLTWYGYLTDAALERTVVSLEILGWDPRAHNGDIETLNNTGILAGHEAEIVVENETYEGKTDPKVKWVNAVGGLGSGMDATAAKATSARLRQKILSIGAGGPTPSRQPGPARQPATAGAAPAGKPLTEPLDDLPF